ncbi:MAG TPA: rod shape-determining protein MreC [Candidatus Paceibacterota bacterium]|nr:rod shape-determining protein MreC [Candidatus Paceibacterota bacterium]
MTTISPRRRRGSSNSRLRAIIAVVLFVIVFLIVTLLRDPVSGLLWRVAGPLSGVRNSAVAATSIFFSGFSSQSSLAAENAALRAELASSSILLLDRTMLYTENLDLKSRLNRNPGFSSTLATVISRPPATPYDTLMLDIGSQHGVVVGDLVAAGGSVYIGTITQVYPTTARALLFSAPGETYQATLAGTSTHAVIPVSVSGQGGGGLTAQVPAGTAVKVGDRVQFPSIIPQFIASVVSIESKEADSFKTIYMQLPVNPLELQFVEVRHPHI